MNPSKNFITGEDTTIGLYYEGDDREGNFLFKGISRL